MGGFAAGAPQGTTEEPRGGGIPHFAEQPPARTETAPVAFSSMHVVQL